MPGRISGCSDPEHGRSRATAAGWSPGRGRDGLIGARYAQRYGDTLAALVLAGPLVGTWEAAAQLLALPEMPDAPLDSGTLSRDALVPVEGSRAGIEHLKGERSVERIYPEARHEIFDEVHKDEVLADVTAFIDDVLASRR